MGPQKLRFSFEVLSKTDFFRRASCAKKIAIFGPQDDQPRGACELRIIARGVRGAAAPRETVANICNAALPAHSREHNNKERSSTYGLAFQKGLSCQSGLAFEKNVGEGEGEGEGEGYLFLGNKYPSPCKGFCYCLLLKSYCAPEGMKKLRTCMRTGACKRKLEVQADGQRRRRTSEKASSTLRSSRAVPHPSTNRALRRLTSEFGRDPVHSTRYGRWRQL